MGTRNLTAVMIDGEYKIAQYGQWDGYPSYQGVRALDFLHNADLEQFKEAVRKTRWLTAEEVETLNKNGWRKTHNHLSRDHGAKILHLVAEGATELINDIDFAKSFSCEWAYVIDFDTNTFEVYKGYNTEPEVGGRFGEKILDYTSLGNYYPPRRVKSYSLDSLPTEEEFLSDLEPEVVEDEE